jgi:hypothetical protein
MIKVHLRYQEIMAQTAVIILDMRRELPLAGHLQQEFKHLWGHVVLVPCVCFLSVLGHNVSRRFFNRKLKKPVNSN